ncbi:MAG: DUF2752 domain-containing protein [Bacteroidetes bacterium]|nr:DUF2752 domain-containing protein [Bacteroidota bacterium]MBU1720054.1 DUF2752 domain-containing protein [Bacteroidota bacterium]
MLASIVEFLERNQLACPYKKYLGIECPGCGMQSAFILLLKGDLTGSIEAWPPLIPLMLTILILILHLIFKFRNGALYLKISFIFTAALVIINYVIKQTL